MPRRSLRAATVALLATAFLAPVDVLWAHPGGGGWGGGGHASAGGMGGGGGAHVGGGHPAGGFSGGPRFASPAPHFNAGARMAPAPRFVAPAPRSFNPAPRFASPAPHYNAVAPSWNAAASHGHASWPPSYALSSHGTLTARAGIAPHAPVQYGQFNNHGGNYGHGSDGRPYEHGGDHGYGGYRHDGDHDGYFRHHWDGGYWHGHYWPPVYYRPGFVWFLPVLPAYCVTYWWDGIPYYYYNEAYYTWDPNEAGYVATEPPPVEDGVGPDGGAAYPDAPPPADSSYGTTYSAPDTDAPASDPNAAAQDDAAGGAGDNLYAYPQNGQSPEQQAQDRRECAQWAQGQSPASADASSTDYKRALTACLSARGYSVD